MRAMFEVEAGRFIWSSIRNIVARENMRSGSVIVREGSGFLSRPFFISGDVESIGRIRRAVDALRHLTVEVEAPRASWKKIDEAAASMDVTAVGGFGIFKRSISLSGHPNDVYEVLNILQANDVAYTRVYA